MKKMMMILFCVAIFASLAMAQNAVYTSGVGITSAVDVLGAHNNYGRGCAGCHAPHSGARGAGGNGIGGTVVDPLTGSNALFAQDMGPLFASGWSAAFGDSGGYTVNPSVDAVPTATAYTQLAEVRGILMCLACHDGAVAKGGMMQGVLWEQTLLPAGVYGTGAIPTLLGADGSGLTKAAAYNNDHPVGPQANFKALGLSTYFPTASTSALGAPTGQYLAFANNYGFPALQGSAWSMGLANPDSNTNVNNLFVTCTTCHNQHVMYVYKSPATNGSLAKGNTYPTYFFINSPYNPGASVSAASGKASSATQFCRQCHFGESNEAMNINSVTTQF
jgi:cytochrome c553